MGWKNLKDCFGIKGHIVCVTAEGVCIGSGYVPKLVTIDPKTGMLKEAQSFEGFLERNYPEVLTATPEEIKALLDAPDTFEKSIPVYTFHEHLILTEYCEEPGWPNVTHMGSLMYDNRYSTDRATVVAWAKQSLASEIRYAEERGETLLAELEDLKRSQATAKEGLAALTAQYPEG